MHVKLLFIACANILLLLEIDLRLCPSKWNHSKHTLCLHIYTLLFAILTNVFMHYLFFFLFFGILSIHIYMSIERVYFRKFIVGFRESYNGIAFFTKFTVALPISLENLDKIKSNIQFL